MDFIGVHIRFCLMRRRDYIISSVVNFAVQTRDVVYYKYNGFQIIRIMYNAWLYNIGWRVILKVYYSDFIP
jgi:hypothetical protein